MSVAQQERSKAVGRPRPSAVRLALGLAFVTSSVIAGCSRVPETPTPGTARPVYNKDTGRLEELVSDRDGDGKVDTRAFMEGARIARIEIDRDGDERPDRLEQYAMPTGGEESVIASAEERGGTPPVVTRRETYVAGVIARVEEDTDANGRVDKWERYDAGRLTTVEIDLKGTGKPTRRFHYGDGGNVDRIEADEDGDGIFTLFSGAGREEPDRRGRIE